MRVLSLFDGISCGRVALERIGIVPTMYFASEISSHAISVALHNYPSTVQLGGVQVVRKMVEANALGCIDLLIGGSPCQGFSRAGNNLGFDDPRSKLVFDYIAIKNVLKPKWFLLENVKMKVTDQRIISLLLGVEPIEIDSASFSGQRRKRLYWTNIPIGQIIDRSVHLWSVIDWHNVTPASNSWHQWFWRNHVERTGKGFVVIANDRPKAATMTARQYANWNGNVVRLNPAQFRWLSRVECERLQTLPDGYCASIPLMKAYHAIGNGWTVDVIAHILKGMMR